MPNEQFSLRYYTMLCPLLDGVGDSLDNIFGFIPRFIEK